MSKSVILMKKVDLAVTVTISSRGLRNSLKMVEEKVASDVTFAKEVSLVKRVTTTAARVATGMLVQSVWTR